MTRVGHLNLCVADVDASIAFYDIAARLDEAGVPITERQESPACTGFKCRDPDGYWIEVYCEPRL